jgi:NADH-quinone oxidoreductase subunit G
MNAAQMLEAPRQCYLLWGIEPDYDIDNPVRAMNALRQSASVISVVSHASATLREVSDVILPLAPQAETEGSMVNLDGSVISFKAAGATPGEARPGWKILRRIGSEIGLKGFAQINIEDVQKDMLAEQSSAHPITGDPELAQPSFAEGLYRAGELPMYSVDVLCRRSEPLQQTQQADSAFVGLNPADAERIGLQDGALARVRQGDGQAELKVRVSESIPVGGAWLRCAIPASCGLGHAIAPLTVEVA